MKIILITRPDFFEDELPLVNDMFADGLEILHLRKPNYTFAEMENFVLSVSPRWRNRVVVHSHFELVERFGLRGAHMGVNRPLNIEGFKGTKSFSCHSLKEVETHKPECNYVFLSPIFNSISKQGYNSAFTSEDLSRAHSSGLIDHKVMALGGIDADNIDIVRRLGFGGVAVLGTVWKSQNPVEALRELLAVVK